MKTTQPLLITGATGTLGQAFRRLCHLRGLPAVALDRAALDITSAPAIAQALRKHQPWTVVNAAGYVRVDDAESDVARCFRENTLGPELLAQACATHGLPLLTFSSDLVFDGAQATPYRESDAPRPLNVYGRSKMQAEQAVLAHLPTALVIRTSTFFSAWDTHNFVHHVLTAARAGRPFAAADDLFISPTYVPDLVNTALDLLLDEASGRWHLANQGASTWAELARLAIHMAGLDAACVVPRPAASFGWAARRPRYSALGSEHGALLPSVESGLRRHLADEQLLCSAHPLATMLFR
jgi:dTDP-4-dehydrorhamnose reductase